MKVTAVFTACLALAVAWVPDDAAIANVPHVQWIPSGKNIGVWADHSAIPVKVAQSIFRTYGFDQPSDVDIDNYAEDVDYSDEDAPANLRSLYTEPVLIFLKSSDNNVVGYYADRGINSIKAYPETHNTLQKLLGSSNVVVLTYRPEKFLYPADRNAVSSRFFVPKNFRIAPLLAFDRAAESNRIYDAPVVIRKLASRTPIPEFDIDKIPYSHRYPVTLKATETPNSPFWKDAIPNPIHASDVDYAPNAYRTLPARHHQLDALMLKQFCAKYPHACARLLKINAESDDTPATVLKAYSHVSPIDPAKTTILKTANTKYFLGSDDALNLCAKNPLACGVHSRKAPFLKSSILPNGESLANIPYSADSLHDAALTLDDANINNPNGRVIVPKPANKFNAPVITSTDYSEDYNPVTIHSPGHGRVLKTLLGY